MAINWDTGSLPTRNHAGILSTSLHPKRRRPAIETRRQLQMTEAPRECWVHASFSMVTICDNGYYICTWRFPETGGTPKWSILRGVFLINQPFQPFGGTPIDGNHHICLNNSIHIAVWSDWAVERQPIPQRLTTTSVKPSYQYGFGPPPPSMDWAFICKCGSQSFVDHFRKASVSRSMLSYSAIFSYFPLVCGAWVATSWAKKCRCPNLPLISHRSPHSSHTTGIWRGELMAFNAKMVWFGVPGVPCKVVPQFVS